MPGFGPTPVWRSSAIWTECLPPARFTHRQGGSFFRRLRRDPSRRAFGKEVER
jgi:hypothetical protein